MADRGGPYGPPPPRGTGRFPQDSSGAPSPPDPQIRPDGYGTQPSWGAGEYHGAYDYSEPFDYAHPARGQHDSPGAWHQLPSPPSSTNGHGPPEYPQTPPPWSGHPRANGGPHAGASAGEPPGSAVDAAPAAPFNAAWSRGAPGEQDPFADGGHLGVLPGDPEAADRRAEAFREQAEPTPTPPPGEGRAARRRRAKRNRRRRRLSATKEIPILIGVALLIALVLKTFLVQAFVIPSGSMEQTIRIGDRVLVDKLTPWFGSRPERGDVVVFEDPGGWLKTEPSPPDDSPPGIKQGKELLTFIGLLPSDDEQDLIKRVVAVGGDTVKCCTKAGKVTVNGRALHEPYINPGDDPSRVRFTVQVPKGRIFVMGDHRGNSADSRYHLRDPGRGTVPEERVVGRALVIAWPFDHWRRLQEPGTYASVPDAPGAPNAAGDGVNRVTTLPFSAELPLVIGVVGLYRITGRRQRGVRSERGGCGSRRMVRLGGFGGSAVGRRRAGQ